MTFFCFRAPAPLGVVLVALATTACQDATAPALADNKPAVGSPPSTIVSSTLVVKPKTNGPVIESVQLSTSWLELNNGTAASYTVTIENPFGRTGRTYTDVHLQGMILQGAVAVGAGGVPVMCNGGPSEVLPLGTCTYNGSISTMPGAASLTPGPAIFELTLHSHSDAFTPVIVSIPVTLVSPSLTL